MPNKNEDGDDDDDDDDYDDSEKDDINQTDKKKKLTKKEKRKLKREKREKKMYKKKMKKISSLQKRHWIETIYITLKTYYYKTFGKVKFEHSSFDQFPREEAHEFAQNIQGLIFGALLTYMFFFLLVFTFRRDIDVALYFCMVLLIISVFGISFSKNARCVFFLVLPCLASSRLRWVLLMYASVLTAVGPGINVMRNALTFRSSILCVYDQIRMNIEILKMIVTAPFRLIQITVKAWVAAIKLIWSKLKSAFSLLKFSMFNSGKAVTNQVNYFQLLMNACNDKTALYNQCLIFFNNLYHNCWHKMIIGKSICYLIRYISGNACKLTEKLGKMCDNAKMKITKFNSTIAKQMVKRVNKAFDVLLDKIGRTETQINFNQTLSKDKPLEGVEVTNIPDELKSKSDKLLYIISKVRLIVKFLVVIWTLFAIVFVFFQASMFRKKWLKKDSFQNVYLTAPFGVLEQDALENNKPTTLPLVGPEKKKYVKLDSTFWSKSEKRAATRGATVIFISCISMIATMILDLLMYFILIIMEPLYDESYKSEKSVQLQIIITGVSTIASFVKSILSVLGPLREFITDVDLPLCKPVPRRPNMLLNVMITGIVILTLISIIFQVKILRLRHRIMIAFYPKRAFHRAMWLRNYIRNNRGTTKHFMLANVVNKIKHKKNKEAQTMQQDNHTIVGYLISRSKVWATILKKVGFQRVFCLSCNAEGNPKKVELFSRQFTQCKECQSIFCKSCYLHFNNVCLVCKIPLDTMEREVDMQKLSSDEEYEFFKARYDNLLKKKIKRDEVPKQEDSE